MEEIVFVIGDFMEMLTKNVKDVMSPVANAKDLELINVKLALMFHFS